MSDRSKVCDCPCLPCVRAGYHWPDECGVGTGVNVFKDREQSGTDHEVGARSSAIDRAALDTEEAK